MKAFLTVVFVLITATTYTRSYAGNPGSGYSNSDANRGCPR